MRSSSLLLGLFLVSPVVYAQRSPVASTTPAPAAHTTPASSPSMSSSSASHSASPSPSSSSSSIGPSSSSNHSSGGGFAPSISHSSSSSGMSSSAGMGSSPSSRHEPDRNVSRDSGNAGGHNSGAAAGSSNSGSSHGGNSSLTGLPSTHDTKRDTSTAGRGDPDQDIVRRRQGVENAPRIDPKIGPKIAGPHEKDAATGGTISPGNGSRTQIGRDTDDRPDAVGRMHGQCDKEPCAKPAPRLSQSDWRLGRCQEGPCEPCPTGTSPTKYGNCVANAKPAAAAPAGLCPGGKIWNGASCVNEYETGLASSRISASRCLYYFSESNRLSSKVTLAKQQEREECWKDSKGAECSFAHMDVLTAESACSTLSAQTPADCQSLVLSCL